VTTDDRPELNEARCAFVGRGNFQPARGRFAWVLLAFTGRRIGGPSQVRDSPSARPKYDSMGAGVDLKVGASPPHTRWLALLVSVSEAKADVAEHSACVRASVPQVDIDADVAKSGFHVSERDG
jgi:hypothetical protein